MGSSTHSRKNDPIGSPSITLCSLNGEGTLLKPQTLNPKPQTQPGSSGGIQNDEQAEFASHQRPSSEGLLVLRDFSLGVICLWVSGFGFRGLGSRGLGLGIQRFTVLGVQGLGPRDLGFRGLGFIQDTGRWIVSGGYSHVRLKKSLCKGNGLFSSGAV